jgi:hypothetical protein
MSGSPLGFPVEDSLSRTKVKTAIGHRYNYLAAHDLRSAAGFCCPLQMRVRVVLTGAVVLGLADRCMGSQLLQPALVIAVEATFIVVYQKTTVVEPQRGCQSS